MKRLRCRGAFATYVDGDITVKEFPDRAARDEADEIAVFYWQRDDEVPDAPKALTDGRLVLTGGVGRHPASSITMGPTLKLKDGVDPYCCYRFLASVTFHAQSKAESTCQVLVKTMRLLTEA